MQKFVVYDSELGEYVGQDPTATDNYKLVYLASEVDACVAELERKNGLLWQRLHDLDEQLLDVLAHWRGTVSHELIVDLLTECRTS